MLPWLQRLPSVLLNEGREALWIWRNARVPYPTAASSSPTTGRILGLAGGDQSLVRAMPATARRISIKCEGVCGNRSPVQSRILIFNNDPQPYVQFSPRHCGKRRCCQCLVPVRQTRLRAQISAEHLLLVCLARSPSSRSAWTPSSSQASRASTCTPFTVAISSR